MPKPHHDNSRPVGSSSTFERRERRRDSNRISRRSRSHASHAGGGSQADPSIEQAVVEPPPVIIDQAFVLPTPAPLSSSIPDNISSTNPSEIMYTPGRNSIDTMERGFACLRHPEIASPPKTTSSPNQEKPRAHMRYGRVERAYQIIQKVICAILRTVFDIVVGRHKFLARLILFWASVLGLIMAISAVFGWPILPLIRTPHTVPRSNVVPEFRGEPFTAVG